MSILVPELCPTLLEIGPGRGDFLMELARQKPQARIGAIEARRKRFDKLVPKLARYPNVTLFWGDARWILPTFPTGSLEEIFVLFSDPWPKRRHAKHRLFQDSFVRDLEGRLKVGGRVVVTTDDPVYGAEIESQFSKTAGLHRLPDDHFFFPTFYAQKWKEAGRPSLSLIYGKGF